MIVLEAHDVAVGPGFEGDRAVGGSCARVELSRLRDRAAGELRPADPSRKAEVVLDPPRRTRLPTERRTLHDQRLKAFRRGVHRRAQAGRTAPDHDEIDLLASGELESDPQRARELAARRVAQLQAAWQPHERNLSRIERINQRRRIRTVRMLGIAPDMRETIAASKVDD